jgi:hypothetical protein
MVAVVLPVFCGSFVFFVEFNFEVFMVIKKYLGFVSVIDLMFFVVLFLFTNYGLSLIWFAVVCMFRVAAFFDWGVVVSFKEKLINVLILIFSSMFLLLSEQSVGFRFVAVFYLFVCSGIDFVCVLVNMITMRLRT